MPEMLWAIVLASNLEREDYLELFRGIVRSARERVKDYEKTYITHGVISTLSEDVFDIIFSNVLAREDALDLLSSLLLFEDIPDIHHWQRHLPKPDPDRHWSIMAKAVADCFDHQSEKATDCRWLKVIFMLAIGKMKMPNTMMDRGKEIIEYPNTGDMRSVRPSIRAMEMAFRSNDLWPDSPTSWSKTFWQECWEKTYCRIREPGSSNPLFDQAATKMLLDIYRQVAEYFHLTLKGTDIDPRHDGALSIKK